MTIPPAHALGVDIGSTNTKVIVIAIDAAGNTRDVALHSVPTPDDVATLLSAVDEGIRLVLHASGAVPQVVGIASMAETGAPLDVDGRAIRPLVRWNGDRDARDADALLATFGASELFAATGVPAGPKAPLATWLWLRRSDPALFRRMARWAGAAELACLSLTGEFVTDHTLAARSMAYRLPHPGEALPREFDVELLAAVGLKTHQLATVAPPGATAGSVTPHAAGRTGLPAGTPVVVAGHDHAVGAWGAGVREPGEAADSVGTAEALFRVLGSPAGRDDVDREAVRSAGMSLGRTVTGDRQSLIAGIAEAGSLIRWWFDSPLGGADPAAVFAAVDELPAGPGTLLVLPYRSGRQSPAPDPSARLRILDALGEPVDPATCSAAELTRGLLEGLCLQLRWMDAEQRRISASPNPDGASGTIRVLGGAGAANRTWLRIKAEVMPAPLALVPAPEPVASGAALLAAVRLGLAPPDATVSRPEPCTAGGGAAFDAAYRRFVSAATTSRKSTHA